MQYLILTDERPDLLAAAVEHKDREGWIAQGGVAVAMCLTEKSEVMAIFAQAMVRADPNDSWFMTRQEAEALGQLPKGEIIEAIDLAEIINLADCTLPNPALLLARLEQRRAHDHGLRFPLGGKKAGKEAGDEKSLSPDA